MFRRFGSQVTVIERGPQLLAREDDDVAAEVANILREDGVEVLLQTKTLRVEPGPDGKIQVIVVGPDGERAVTGSHLLVATGRTPNTDRLNVAAAGLTMDARGFIRVNARLETNVPNIYAMGDVNGGPAFTHISYDDYRIMRANLLDEGNQTTTGRLVPYVVYMDPQLGSVGMTARQAQAAGKRVRVAKMPMSYVARALETDEPRGLMKAVVDAETGQILGCTILGAEGGELMSMIELAMMGKLPYTALRDAVFAHPTFAEAFNNLFATLDQ
jgi:pyruvate/2-oxoglutarate dehydrogenase complex dihydrolipoamide dehydrogenase (E3) component